MRLSLVFGLSNRSNEQSAPTGPTVDTAGSIDVSTFKIGTTQTITAGTATASGGGVVSYEFRHLSDGEVKSTLAGYAHVAADDTESGVAQWRAVETGGTNPGETSWQTVASGTITYNAPANTVAPAVTGSTSIGDELSSTQGTWTGSDISYSYQWQRNTVDISGETSSTYNIVQADDNASIRCVVTATNSGGAISANSNAVAIDDFAVPVITGVPTISGTEEVGEVLTATAASVTGNPSPSTTWQWERSGTPISGATSSTYTLVAADEGETLTVVQTETNALDVDSAESAATGTIGSSSFTYTLSNYSQNTSAGTGFVEITFDYPAGAVGETVYLEIHDTASSYPGRGLGAIGSQTLSTLQSGSTVLNADLRDYYSQDVILYITVGAAGESNSLEGAQFTLPESAPEDAQDSEFSVATGPTETQSINLTISSEPTVHSDGTQAPDYRVDGGSWTAVPSYTGTGTYQLSMAAASTSYDIEIRWTNEIGSGAANPTAKSATSSTAGAGYSDPSDDADAIHWWDFSDEASITDTAGAVTSVSDKIGSLTLTANGDPETGNAANDINSLNCLRFVEADNDHLSATLAVDASGDIAFHCVVDIDGGSGTRSIFSADGTNDFQFEAEGDINTSNAWTSFSLSGGTLYDRTPSLVVVSLVCDKTTGTTTAYVNGVSEGSSTYSSNLDTSLTFRINSNRSGSSEPYGRQCEYIITEDVSASRLSDHVGYLATKWGITLP